MVEVWPRRFAQDDAVHVEEVLQRFGALLPIPGHPAIPPFLLNALVPGLGRPPDGLRASGGHPQAR